MHTITLYRTDKGWMAEHSDPRITALFGTDVLPTAYTARAEPETVRAAIEDLNPDCRVFVRDERSGTAVSGNLAGALADVLKPRR